MERINYGSWKIAVPMSVLLSFLGMTTGNVDFFIAALIPVIVLFMSYLARTPDPDQVELERTIEDKAPNPGNEVEVKLAVKNTGRKTLTDVRVVDNVPDELKVTSGSPRASVPLTPGSEAEISYSVIARRGSHVFGDANIELRGGGQHAEVGEKQVKGDEMIECKTELKDIVLRDSTDQQSGDIVTSKGGSGIEFHSLRDYKSGDPPSRVEWKHLAKTGELAAKNFREERTGNIILVIDARKVSDRKADEGHPTGTEVSAYAAKRVFKSLKKSRHRPGVAVLGVENEEIEVTTDSSTIPYIKPSRSRDKEKKVDDLIREVHKAEKKSEADLKSRLYKMLPPNSQVVFFTPLLDDELESVVQILDNHGFPSIVFSPDVTYGENYASRLERVRRNLRIRDVKSFSPVIDWDIRRPISIQVSKAVKEIYARDI